VLLLDEPLSNLDAKLRVQMRQELKSLQRRLGITTIFVTHDQEEALTTCDRIAVMDQGVIQQVGTPVELYDRPANRFVANFVGTINLVSGNVGKSADGMLEFKATAGIDAIKLPADAAHATSGRAELAIRPHSLALTAAGTTHDPTRLTLAARVQESEFLGEFVRYRIAVNGMEWIADQPHSVGATLFAPGSDVNVSLDTRDARLLPG
jgi:iron(III) transport system ATP-binding protein